MGGASISDNLSSNDPWAIADGFRRAMQDKTVCASVLSGTFVDQINGFMQDAEKGDKKSEGAILETPINTLAEYAKRSQKTDYWFPAWRSIKCQDGVSQENRDKGYDALASSFTRPESYVHVALSLAKVPHDRKHWEQAAETNLRQLGGGALDAYKNALKLHDVLHSNASPSDHGNKINEFVDHGWGVHKLTQAIHALPDSDKYAIAGTLRYDGLVQNHAGSELVELALVASGGKGDNTPWYRRLGDSMALRAASASDRVEFAQGLARYAGGLEFRDGGQVSKQAVRFFVEWATGVKNISASERENIFLNAMQPLSADLRATALAYLHGESRPAVEKIVSNLNKADEARAAREAAEAAERAKAQAEANAQAERQAEEQAARQAAAAAAAREQEQAQDNLYHNYGREHRRSTENGPSLDVLVDVLEALSHATNENDDDSVDEGSLNDEVDHRPPARERPSERADEGRRGYSPSHSGRQTANDHGATQRYGGSNQASGRERARSIDPDSSAAPSWQRDQPANGNGNGKPVQPESSGFDSWKRDDDRKQVGLAPLSNPSQQVNPPARRERIQLKVLNNQAPSGNSGYTAPSSQVGTPNKRVLQVIPSTPKAETPQPPPEQKPARKELRVLK